MCGSTPTQTPCRRLLQELGAVLDLSSAGSRPGGFLSCHSCPNCNVSSSSGLPSPCAPSSPCLFKALNKAPGSTRRMSRLQLGVRTEDERRRMRPWPGHEQARRRMQRRPYSPPPRAPTSPPDPPHHQSPSSGHGLEFPFSIIPCQSRLVHASTAHSRSGTRTVEGETRRGGGGSWEGIFSPRPGWG